MEYNLTKEVAQALISNLSGAKAFVLEQAPDVLRQMLEYGIWSNSVYVVLAGLFFLIGVALFAVGLFKWEETGPSFAGFMIALFSFVTGLQPFMLLIKIHTAPKLYLIDQLHQLL